MNNQQNRFRAALAACLLTSLAMTTSVPAAELSVADKAFLAQYETVHAALAADNLAEAKKAATTMGEDGAPLARSETIAAARKEFETMSERALKLAAGQAGYYHVNCPMLKKDWVQTSKEVSNPYGGKEMLTCGAVKS